MKTRGRLIGLLVAGLLGFVAGCDNERNFNTCKDAGADGDMDSGTDGDTDTGSTVPNGDYLDAIFAVASGDVFAVGTNGKILHYDGLDWTWMESPTKEFLSGLWGNSHDNVFAVGRGGTLIRFDGDGWQFMSSPTGVDLVDVWGVADGEVFAVGKEGTIVRFDGEQWTPMGSGTVSNLSGVWGSSSSDVYAVGEPTDDGVVLHYDGSSWSYLEDVPPNPDPSPSPRYFPQHAVWGASPGDVYIAGDNELNPFEDCWGVSIAHFDGLAWKEVFKNTCVSEGPFLSLWGSSAENVYTVSSAPELYHFDGTQWTELDPLSPVGEAFVQDIHGCSATEFYAAGGYGYGYPITSWQPEIWRHDGMEWTPVFGPDE
ncbi:MAG: hypothetical protein PHU25_03535 [Deltaproteobacteria bacterium]|nr:hypothetical protein [Deltaproteobacteria bacterium]